MVYLKDNLGESWKDLAVCLKIPSPKIKAIEAEAWQVRIQKSWLSFRFSIISVYFVTVFYFKLFILRLTS